MIFLCSLIIACSVGVIGYYSYSYYQDNLQLKQMLSIASKPKINISANEIVQKIVDVAGIVGEKLIHYKYFQSSAVKVRRYIATAATPITPESVLGMQIFAFIAVFFVVGVVRGNILSGLFFGVVFYFFPVYWVKSKATRKQKQVIKDLPNFLDLLTLTIESGLDFNAALQRIVTQETGPLIDEFKKTQKEIGIGETRQKAYENLAARINLETFSYIITALNQAIATGAGIGGQLRTLSNQFRNERMQSAERAAQKAMLKMMIPMLVLILPTIFIMLFGMILLSMTQTGIWTH